jgi:gamma-glutamylcyclotransferase
MQFCIRKLGFAGAHIAERAFPQQSLVKNAESPDFWFIQPVRHRASRTPVLLPRRVMTRPRVRYFAYGSNMLTARLRERVPSAAAIGIGQLVGHALRWDKRSWQDGSGKCDAEATSRNDDVVWGVLFELDPEDKPALDKAEGVGAGYLEKTVNVLTEAGRVTAVTYCANDKDSTLRPYHWYKALVIAGAREHGLPASYRSGLELVVTVSDTDTARASRHKDLLPDDGQTHR